MAFIKLLAYLVLLSLWYHEAATDAKNQRTVSRRPLSVTRPWTSLRPRADLLATRLNGSAARAGEALVSAAGEAPPARRNLPRLPRRKRRERNAKPSRKRNGRKWKYDKEERRRRRLLQQRRKLRLTLGLPADAGKKEQKKQQERRGGGGGGGGGGKKFANSFKKQRKARGKKMTKPNIIFFLVDDLGYNDVPWHNPDIRAPEMLRLARKGIVLENHYVLPLCTPSRAALLTGHYPFRYGRQGSHSPLSPTGLNTSLTLLPQRLRSFGYRTHLVGKWHLGYCNKAYTPTARGFDSFYGFYLGSQDYYTQYRQLGPKKGSPFWSDKNEVLFDHDFGHSPPDSEDELKDLEGDSSDSDDDRRRSWLNDLNGNDGGYDFRFNDTPLRNVSGIYSNNLYAARAKDIIKEHAAKGSKNNPLFLMLSLQAVHGPVDVPLDYRRQHRNVKNLARRTFHGMLSALDDVVGHVVTELKKSGLYHNSIIVFTTDNGGNIRSGGNNFPLRGNKGGVFEGGTRGVAFIHSPLLPKTGFKYEGLMHIVDWQSTLLHAAGANKYSFRKRRGGGHVKPSKDSDSDSDSDSDTWDEDDEPQGEEGDGLDLWDAITTNSESPRTSFVYNVRKGPLRGAIRRRHWKLIVGGGGRYDGWVPPSDVSAGGRFGSPPTRCCSSWHTNLPANNVVLYNVRDDPLETTDISHLYPDVAATLKSRLRSYAAQSVHPHNPRDDPNGHPRLHGGFYSPGWCDAIV
ncbi:arylsulfatase I-like [Penaeus japonicus]|uniref:arylsulfatase I-like n=1 Tax=Penaeus japonicus TaxID=27405 RepID=UPI001C70F0B7|nr:arylsulfatase I-like [Penaeus japonicus]XP_042866573.1 arylsulfatase I-like [Penaeus japonicus]